MEKALDEFFRDWIYMHAVGGEQRGYFGDCKESIHRVWTLHILAKDCIDIVVATFCFDHLTSLELN